MLTKRKKALAIKKVQLHDTDTGSAPSQIAILSKRIEELTSHLKSHKNDNHSRRGLVQMVSDRRKHLKYLLKSDPKKYKKVIEELGIRG